MSAHPIVVAITGGSGAPYAVRLLQVLSRGEQQVHLTISPSGVAVIQQELGIGVDLNDFQTQPLLNCRYPWDKTTTSSPAQFDDSRFVYHHYQDYMTPIASGSFLTSGMIICPCSGSTLSGISRASASNLIQRAAEVHLKERRKLVLVPRETPLSTLALENMQRVSAAGAVVLPAMPGWYHGVQSLDDLIDFMVARILDQFGLGEGLMRRWSDGS
jgi:4-hydroxy-3-polyprenylbenzoate decarboxylase